MATLSSTASSINSVVNQSDNYGAPARIVQAIKNAAIKTGADFSYLLKKAAQESGFDATAKAATSSATGLFQFTSQTWLHMVKTCGAQYGLGNYASQISSDTSGHLSVNDATARQAILALRNDPQVSAEMAGELDKQNTATLQQTVGGKIGGTELYLAHFLGAGGASDFINTLRNSPNAAAASVLPDAAAANQSVFYSKAGHARTVSEIYQNFAQKFDHTPAPTQTAEAVSTRSSAVTTMSIAAASSSITETAHVPVSLAGLFSSSSSVSGSLSPTSSVAGFRSADGGNMVLSGSSTLFTAMVLGQMHGAGFDANSSMAALEASSDKKKAGYAVAAAVA